VQRAVKTSIMDCTCIYLDASAAIKIRGLSVAQQGTNWKGPSLPFSSPAACIQLGIQEAEKRCKLPQRGRAETTGINHGGRGISPPRIWSGDAKANCLPRFCDDSKFQTPYCLHCSARRRHGQNTARSSLKAKNSVFPCGRNTAPHIPLGPNQAFWICGAPLSPHISSQIYARPPCAV